MEAKIRMKKDRPLKKWILSNLTKAFRDLGLTFCIIKYTDWALASSPQLPLWQKVLPSWQVFSTLFIYISLIGMSILVIAIGVVEFIYKGCTCNECKEEWLILVGPGETGPRCPQCPKCKGHNTIYVQ